LEDKLNEIQVLKETINAMKKLQNGKHRKQRSSTTLALDQLDDDFASIAKNVQAYGNKQPMVSGPTHYRKFSHTTKMIMDKHKKKSMKIGDIGDENGIEYVSDEQRSLPQHQQVQQFEIPSPQRSGLSFQQQLSLWTDQLNTESVELRKQQNQSVPSIPSVVSSVTDNAILLMIKNQSAAAYSYSVSNASSSF